MKNFLYGLLAIVLSAFPGITLASGHNTGGSGGIAGGETTGSGLGSFLSNTLKFIDGVVIPFILAIGFLVFIWGIFKYFILGGANDEAKESGKSLIMYAIGGFVIILAFWGIVNLFSSTTGLNNETLKDIPKVQIIK